MFEIISYRSGVTDFLTVTDNVIFVQKIYDKGTVLPSMTKRFSEQAQDTSSGGGRYDNG